MGLVGADTFFAVYVHTGLFVAAAALCALRVAASPHERAPWALLAGGIGCWALGSAAWDAIVAGDATPAVPSAADLGWILFYVAAFPAFWLLVRARLRVLHRSAWMDGLLTALSAAALVPPSWSRRSPRTRAARATSWP